MTQSKQSNTKKKIEEAATDLFSSRGFQSTSVREIANEAGVGKPMIYYYFDSKDGLYRYLIKKALEPFARNIKGLRKSEDDPEEKLRELMRMRRTHLRENPGLASLIGQAITGREKYVEGMIRDHFRNIHGVFREIIREGMEKKVFKKFDSDIAAMSLNGVMLFFAYHMNLIEEVIGEDEENLMESVEEHLLGLYSVHET